MTDWLLKHPWRHFIIIFSLLFTATFIVNAIQVRLFHSASSTEAHIFCSSFVLALILFFWQRYRFRNIKP